MTMLKKTALVATTSALVLAAGLAQAAVSGDKASQLGGTLTPVGAEKAGNAAGTIPAWDGGITRAPAGYRAGQEVVAVPGSGGRDEAGPPGLDALVVPLVVELGVHDGAHEGPPHLVELVGGLLQRGLQSFDSGLHRSLM